MQDLSELLDDITLQLILNKYFRGNGSKDHIAYALVANFIRLVDQALKEYEYARESLLEYVNSSNGVIKPLLRATGHFETCLAYIERSINFAEKLKSDPASPNIPRCLSVLSSGATERINKLRNAILHLEKDIKDKKVPEGQPIFLMVKSDSVELSNVEIFYYEIAQWLKNLHTLSSDLAGYSE